MSKYPNYMEHMSKFDKAQYNKKYYATHKDYWVEYYQDQKRLKGTGIKADPHAYKYRQAQQEASEANARKGDKGDKAALHPSSNPAYQKAMQEASEANARTRAGKMVPNSTGVRVARRAIQLGKQAVDKIKKKIEPAATKVKSIIGKKTKQGADFVRFLFS